MWQGLATLLVSPESLLAYRHEGGGRLRVSAGKERDVMAKFDKIFGEP
jgi:hypothetical protein